MAITASPAHPRSRGENVTTVTKARAIEGSSPLTRGKRQKWSVVRIARRLIPAHAGKTAFTDDADLSRAAHPRSRGENSLLTPMLSDKYGSSPLTRGKPGIDSLVNGGGRLIPAHAGKTRRVR